MSTLSALTNPPAVPAFTCLSTPYLASPLTSDLTHFSPDVSKHPCDEKQEKEGEHVSTYDCIFLSRLPKGVLPPLKALKREDSCSRKKSEVTEVAGG